MGKGMGNTASSSSRKFCSKDQRDRVESGGDIESWEGFFGGYQTC